MNGMTLAHAAGALGVALAVLSASCSSADSCGSAAETFVAYAPGASVSAIPLCTSSLSLAAGQNQSSFPGATSLSALASTQCQALCTLSAGGPCCVSVWEPSTVLCAPSCVPR